MEGHQLGWDGLSVLQHQRSHYRPQTGTVLPTWRRRQTPSVAVGQKGGPARHVLHTGAAHLPPHHVLDVQQQPHRVTHRPLEGARLAVLPLAQVAVATDPSQAEPAPTTLCLGCTEHVCCTEHVLFNFVIAYCVFCPTPWRGQMTLAEMRGV